jgi:hypothetical protein
MRYGFPAPLGTRLRLAARLTSASCRARLSSCCLISFSERSLTTPQVGHVRPPAHYQQIGDSVRGCENPDPNRQAIRWHGKLPKARRALAGALLAIMAGADASCPERKLKAVDVSSGTFSRPGCRSVTGAAMRSHTRRVHHDTSNHRQRARRSLARACRVRRISL